jgi:hypothetical protein
VGTGPESTSFLSEREKQSRENSIFSAHLHQLHMMRRMEVAGIEYMFIDYRSLISNTANADNSLLFLYLKHLCRRQASQGQSEGCGGYLQAERLLIRSERKQASTLQLA